MEKIALSAAVIENPKLLEAIMDSIGSQSVVVVLDVKKYGILKKYSIFTHNGTKRVKKNPFNPL